MHDEPHQIKPFIPEYWTQGPIDRSKTGYLQVRGCSKNKAHNVTHALLGYYDGFDPNNFKYYIKDLNLKEQKGLDFTHAICFFFGKDRGGRKQTDIQKAKWMPFFHRLFHKYGAAGLYDTEDMTDEQLKTNQIRWDAAYKEKHKVCAWDCVVYVRPWQNNKGGIQYLDETKSREEAAIKMTVVSTAVVRRGDPIACDSKALVPVDSQGNKKRKMELMSKIGGSAPVKQQPQASNLQTFLNGKAEGYLNTLDSSVLAQSWSQFTKNVVAMPESLDQYIQALVENGFATKSMDTSPMVVVSNLTMSNAQYQVNHLRQIQLNSIFLAVVAMGQDEFARVAQQELEKLRQNRAAYVELMEGEGEISIISEFPQYKDFKHKQLSVVTVPKRVLGEKQRLAGIMELNVFFRNAQVWSEMPPALQLNDGEDEAQHVEKLQKKVEESPLWFYLKNLSKDELKNSIAQIGHKLEVAVLLKEIYLLFNQWYTNIKTNNRGIFEENKSEGEFAESVSRYLNTQLNATNVQVCLSAVQSLALTLAHPNWEKNICMRCRVVFNFVQPDPTANNTKLRCRDCDRLFGKHVSYKFLYAQVGTVRKFFCPPCGQLITLWNPQTGLQHLRDHDDLGPLLKRFGWTRDSIETIYTRRIDTGYIPQNCTDFWQLTYNQVQEAYTKWPKVDPQRTQNCHPSLTGYITQSLLYDEVLKVPENSTIAFFEGTHFGDTMVMAILLDTDDDVDAAGIAGYFKQLALSLSREKNGQCNRLVTPLAYLWSNSISTINIVLDCTQSVSNFVKTQSWVANRVGATATREAMNAHCWAVQELGFVASDPSLDQCFLISREAKNQGEVRVLLPNMIKLNSNNPLGPRYGHLNIHCPPQILLYGEHGLTRAVKPSLQIEKVKSYVCSSIMVQFAMYLLSLSHEDISKMWIQESKTRYFIALMHMRSQIDKLNTRSGAAFAVSLDQIERGTVNQTVVNEVLSGGWVPISVNDAPPRSLDWKESRTWINCQTNRQKYFGGADKGHCITSLQAMNQGMDPRYFDNLTNLLGHWLFQIIQILYDYWGDIERDPEVIKLPIERLDLALANAEKRYQGFGKRIANSFNFEEEMKKWSQEIRMMYKIALYDQMSDDNYLKMMTDIKANDGVAERVAKGIQSADYGASFYILSVRLHIAEMKKSGVMTLFSYTCEEYISDGERVILAKDITTELKALWAQQVVALSKDGVKIPVCLLSLEKETFESQNALTKQLVDAAAERIFGKELKNEDGTLTLSHPVITYLARKYRDSEGLTLDNLFKLAVKEFGGDWHTKRAPDLKALTEFDITDTRTMDWTLVAKTTLVPVLKKWNEDEEKALLDTIAKDVKAAITGSRRKTAELTKEIVLQQMHTKYPIQRKGGADEAMFMDIFNIRNETIKKPAIQKSIVHGKDFMPNIPSIYLPHYGFKVKIPKNFLIWQAYMAKKSDVDVGDHLITFKKMPTFPLFRGPKFPFAHLVMNLVIKHPFEGPEFHRYLVEHFAGFGVFETVVEEIKNKVAAIQHNITPLLEYYFRLLNKYSFSRALDNECGVWFTYCNTHNDIVEIMNFAHDRSSKSRHEGVQALARMETIVFVQNWKVVDLIGSGFYTVMDVGLSTPLSLKEYILQLDGKALTPPINDISYMPNPKPAPGATGTDTDTQSINGFVQQICNKMSQIRRENDDLIVQVSNERTLCEEMVTNFVRDADCTDEQKLLIKELLDQLNERAKVCPLLKTDVYDDVKTKGEVIKIWEEQEAAADLVRQAEKKKALAVIPVPVPPVIKKKVNLLVNSGTGGSILSGTTAPQPSENSNQTGL